MPQYMLLMYHPVEGGPSPEEMAEQHAIRFIDQIRRAFRRVNIELRGVLTDNGPEWVSRDFQQHLQQQGISHRRTPPRSPDHNALCERFQGIALQEFLRPAFHRQRDRKSVV